MLDEASSGEKIAGRSMLITLDAVKGWWLRVILAATVLDMG
jgi:hypothetical protein